ncbi:MAG: diguanylate cyclase domain-containing protein, partial [Campylobacterota bacterium]
MGLQSSLSGKNALKIAGIYFFVSMVWILLSDLTVETFAQSRHQLTLLQTYKGWFFVAFTTLLLYILAKRFIGESLLQYRQKQRLENKLDTYTNLLDTIINSTPDAIYVKDKNGRYLLFNEAAASMVGKNKDEVIGLDDYALFDPDTAQKMRTDDAAVLHEHNITNKEETFSVGDREYSFWITKGIVRDSSADILGTFGISRDITRQKENEQNLSRQKQEYYDLAHYDQLTGLPNRLDMTEKLDAAAREGRVRTLILLDLDLFKIINESYGHPFGDKVLQKVADLLGEIFDRQAEVFRMGGDEFAVVVQYNDRKRIQKEVEEFLDRLAKPILMGEIDIYVTASVGIEDFGPISSDTQKLLQNVDAALGKAKEMGKNTYTFYQVGFTKDAIRHSNTAVNLKMALEKKQLLLHY